jgi:hypothetical protein
LESSVVDKKPHDAGPGAWSARLAMVLRVRMPCPPNEKDGLLSDRQLLKL